MEDTSGFKALLKEEFADLPEAVFLLISAMEEKVPQELLESEGTLLPISISRNIQRLRENRAMSWPAALWTVYCWAFALDKVSRQELDETLAQTPGIETACDMPKPLVQEPDELGQEFPMAPPEPIFFQPGISRCLHCDTKLPQNQSLSLCSSCGQTPDRFEGIPDTLQQALQPGEKLLWFSRPLFWPFVLPHPVMVLFMSCWALLEISWYSSILGYYGFDITTFVIFLILGAIPAFYFYAIPATILSHRFAYYALTNQRFLKQFSKRGGISDIPIKEFCRVQLLTPSFWEKVFRAGSLKIVFTALFISIG